MNGALRYLELIGRLASSINNSPCIIQMLLRAGLSYIVVSHLTVRHGGMNFYRPFVRSHVPLNLQVCNHDLVFRVIWKGNRESSSIESRRRR